MTTRWFIPLFLILPTLSLGWSECLNQPCEQCPKLIPQQGDSCQDQTSLPYIYCEQQTRLLRESSSMFLTCRVGSLVILECPRGTVFSVTEGCHDPTSQLFMQGLSVSGSGRVGDACQYNTDCLSGMYCSGGACACLSTYILRESYCYEKINPNQPGCTYDVQCEAVWPGAKCNMDNSIGTCRCPGETHVARETRDGWVCVSLKDLGTGGTAPLYFVCPLPEGAGFKIALNDPNPSFGSFPVGCTVGSTSSIEPTAGLHGGAACIWPSDGQYIGDTYDCLHTSPHVNLASKFPQSSYSPTADGVCCPSRAFACIQPQATGPNPSEPRWWYNAVTGTCQQFMWDATASEAKFHSANNFKTIQHCESYCRDTCQRGSPQYTVELSSLSERPITSCSSASSCANDYQCTSIGSQHLCCPTATVICSAKGGRPLDSMPRSSVFHPGFMVTTGRETIRFFYDPSQGRCQDFIYKGAGGNYNNFLSKHECEMHCSRLQCERGSPLRIGENAQRCRNNAQCPSSYECKVEQGVCCPRKQTICAQPLRVGDCTENVKRYWYNAKSRQCQMFHYTGCQGNDNNFNTIMDCQNFCKNAIPEPKCIQGQAYKDQFGNFMACSNGKGCPANYDCYYDGSQWGCCPIKAYTCQLNVDSGVQCGAGSTFRYFYNPSTQNCESFTYNGCDGNSNNFATRENCEQYCSVGGCPNGGTPQRDANGMISGCGGAGSCPESHECTSVLAGTASINRCCPTRAYMCSLPPQQGTQCGANFVTRFYFNIVTGQCTSFQFGGCDGNNNNFLSLQQCRNFCMSNSCPAGNVAYVDPNSQMPIFCNEALSNSCPPGFTCTLNSLINNHVCCGATDQGVCPDGEKAFIDTLSLSPRECMINMEASCPANYLCRFNMNKNKYYCCANLSGRSCPVGKFLFKDPRTNQPTRCTTGRNDQCAEGYSCQPILTDAFQGFCCTTNSICPDDGEYAVDEHSRQPRACTMGTFVSCPSGFVCRSHFSSTEGFCCRGPPSDIAPVAGIVKSLLTILDGCPPGNYVYAVSGEIAPCDPFNPSNNPCPGSYTCQWSMSNQRYQCCGSEPLPPPERKNDGCPAGQVASRDSEVVRVCTAGSVAACPSGYFCQFSSVNHQFQCCGVSAGCPASSVAFVGVSGDAERCVVGQSNCPTGFACQRTTSGVFTCCSVNKVECKEDEIENNGECYSFTNPGGPCLLDQQCKGGSFCQEEECKCPKGTKPAGEFCVAPLKCESNEIMYKGECHSKSRVGEGCVISNQCPQGSTCLNAVCECKRGLVERKGACEPPPNTKIAPPRKLSTHSCSKPGSKALRDDINGRVVLCSATRPCPQGYQCQINSKKTQYMCCSGYEEESGSIVSGTVSPDHVCPTGRIPYLVNGSPQSCSGARCPVGYECLYQQKNYYCCSTLAKPSMLTSGTGKNEQGSQECGRGTVLLYPSTKTPVLCATHRMKSCPAGYTCQASQTSHHSICCSATHNDRAVQYSYPTGRYAASPCMGNFVLVSRLVGNRIEKRCERSCPYQQVPIGGVCYEMKD